MEGLRVWCWCKAQVSFEAMTASLAKVARERVQAIVDRFPEVERTNNALGCYFLVRRKIFGQVLTVLNAESEPVTMVAGRPDPMEREALLAIGHPYFSRGPMDDRVGRVAMVIDDHTDWDEVAELLADSYRISAPKKLVAILDSERSP
jgi:hypothetical protein